MQSTYPEKSSSVHLGPATIFTVFSNCFCLNIQFTVKPWPNAHARTHRLRTWVYLRVRLARPCVHLRWLATGCAMTCAHFCHDQICTQVKASFSPFVHSTQMNASWVTSINLLLANEIETKSALKCVFPACMYLRVRLATQHRSLRKFNLRPPATTCRSVSSGL